jgi:hypothetical protein
MKIKWIGSAFVCIAFTFGCGGGDDGVDTSLELGALEAEDIDAICAGTPTETIDCGDFEIMSDEASCIDGLEAIPAECTATVGEFLDCEDDLAAQTDDERCDFESLPESCVLIFDDPDCGGA